MAEQTQIQVHDYDVFEDDLFIEEESENHHTIGRWGKVVLHIMKGAFVLYSGAHNIQATLAATGSSPWAMTAQIVGVLVLEATIAGIYMAAMGGKITGKLQSVVAALFWVTGIVLASMGIVADSRLHAGQELSSFLTWHLTTGLYIAPVIMVIGVALIVFTDPVLSQQIANSRDRAVIQRQKVRTAVIAEKANHESRKIVHSIRLGAQKQMAVFARQYYKSDEVQAVLKDTAIRQLQDVMRQAGIHIPIKAALPAATAATATPSRTPGPEHSRTQALADLANNLGFTTTEGGPITADDTNLKTLADFLALPPTEEAVTDFLARHSGTGSNGKK